MTADTRPEMVKNAVQFLTDPKVLTAPHEKKVAFLESKGMTTAEIEAAVEQAKHMPVSLPFDLNQATPPPIPARIVQEPVQGTSWKDVTLAIIGISALGYGTYHLAAQYLAPYFVFPTPQQLRLDTEKQQADLANLVKALETIQDHQLATSTTIKELNSTLSKLKESDSDRDIFVTKIEAEITSLQQMIPNVTKRTKENQEMMVTDLQNEIKSLKNLLLNRRVLGEEAVITLPSFGLGDKPAIPSWQLDSVNASKAKAKELEALAIDAESKRVSNGDKSAEVEVESMENQEVPANVVPNLQIPAWQIEAANAMKKAAEKVAAAIEPVVIPIIEHKTKETEHKKKAGNHKKLRANASSTHTISDADDANVQEFSTPE